MLIAQPFASATEIATDDDDQRRRVNGRIKKLTVKAPDGAAVDGYLDRLGKWWKAKRTAAAGHRVHGHGARRSRTAASAHKETWKFTTVTPRGYLGVRVVPGDNEIVGVGQPISLRFTGPVANKAAVEERLNVTTSVPVEGSWRWMSDTEAHWRPRDYWPANTEVFFDGEPDRCRRRQRAHRQRAPHRALPHRQTRT